MLDGADLLLNLSGMLTDEDLLGAVATCASYVDLDPAFTQLWHAADGVDMGFDRHDRFVTIGPGDRRAGLRASPTAAVTGSPRRSRSCSSTGRSPTRIDRRRAHDRRHTGAPTARSTTTGVHYGQKAHALRPLLDLPARTGARFRLALGIHPDERDDLEALRASGWELRRPGRRRRHARAPIATFVRGSWAEFGVAKLGYVASRCGWFSDRSVCYLASGRPVVAQDTGFGAWLPAGEGVLRVLATPRTRRPPSKRCAPTTRATAARRARSPRTVFDSERVLRELLACL